MLLFVVHLSTSKHHKQVESKGIDAMSGLFEDGLGLMVLGMGFVFLFLVILIFATGYMSRLLNHFFPEVLPVVTARPVASAPDSSGVDAQLTAVITAAVHQHRNNKNS
ncbi:oxaloacetate decarboxylase subunit gamma [Marinomonas profundimaris]|uniref:Probable oxaloacetate decarboxylase gamma chain n=2 Tax=Marinomonas profundimaris TaxID=1208321 RepID=W1S205_9GAMM|nr:oxaloacetate decarboxylase subunit gamma [Marinomonas profundimaris]